MDHKKDEGIFPVFDSLSPGSSRNVLNIIKKIQIVNKYYTDKILLKWE